MALTPRYQVFISSTYTDLISERQAVTSALLQLGALPAGMELFPAANDEAWTLIQRVIEESDYYLLVIGGRYGSVDAEGIGFTEKEYDYAITAGKPVMAFLHKNPDELPFRASEGEPEAREKLIAFRARVETAKHVKFWSGAEDLAGKVALSFAAFVASYPAVGWVRGDAGDSPETLAKLAAAQDRIAVLESRIEHDATQPPPGASGLADADEQFEMDTEIEMTISNLAPGAEGAPRQKIGFEASLSWNDLLSGLGPLMLDEARQAALLRPIQEPRQRAEQRGRSRGC